MNGRIYVAGGLAFAVTISATVASLEIYDPTSNTWTSGADMPTARAILAASAAKEDLFFIGGGSEALGTRDTSVVESYNPTTNTWTRRADMPTPRVALTVSMANGLIYAIGGGFAVGHLATVEVYDPLKDAWSERTPMPTARWGVTSGLIGRKIYVFGGSTGRGTGHNSLSSNEAYTTAVAAAELELQSVDATDGTYTSADMLTIDTTIMNSGTAGSGMFSIDYYASTDNVISEDDILLATENIGDIAMGATLNHQAMVGVSAIVVAGDYFIGAIITFTDGNTADNSNVDATAVTFLGLFFINAGLNDAWVHPGAPLQGFFFTVFPDLGFLFFAWFTFDSVPPGLGVPPAEFGANDQRWVSGLGAIAGDSVTISVELTSGGVFNASDPEATQEMNYGTITIVFINCDEALLTYNFPGLGLMGQMTLSRVLTDNVALCNALNAELQMMQ